MLNLSAYYKKDMECLKDTQNDIIVNSVGHYRLLSRALMVTSRPKGRPDFQLLYIAQGAGFFLLNGETEKACEGAMVFYEPGSPQRYEYHLEDKPDIYWVHVTGSRAGALLADCGFTHTGIYQAGISSGYTAGFQNMLQEIQLRRESFAEMTALEFAKLCYAVRRNRTEFTGEGEGRNREMEKAVRYFHEGCQEEISIEQYACSINMSVCWFIRSFKEYTGMTPRKFITDLRITKARELLRDQSFSVREVADIVGYANPLYFSRIFKQYTGIMPSQYGKEVR